MLNLLWNITNAPAVNVFRFCSLKDQETRHLNTVEIPQYGYTAAFTIFLFNMENEAVPGAASPGMIHVTGTTIGEEKHSSKAVNSSIATEKFITVHGTSRVKNYCCEFA